MASVEYQPLINLTPEAIRHPEVYFAALREESPVQWIEELGCYAVTRYEDVLAVVRDAEVFSNRMPTGPTAMAEMLEAAQQVFAESPDLVAELSEAMSTQAQPVLLNADPPLHDRQRKLVNRAFSPRRVRQMEEPIRGIADDLIDAFVDRGSCEFVSEFAVGLPLTVIAGALGVPDGDLATFKRWSDDFVVAIGNHLLSKDRLRDMMLSQGEFFRYFTQKIEERRAEPRDDLISDVVHSEIDGEELSQEEMLGMFAQFLVAGNETTTKLLAGMMLLLLENPDTMAAVRKDRDLIPGLVEEGLRLEAPVQGLFRVANVDTEVGGVPIPAGANLWVVYASANRDAAEFPQPNDLDPERANAKSHLAFGQGVHYCLGAALARAEARIGFEALLDRLDDIQLADGVALDSLEFEPSYALRGLKSLPLQFRATS